jgi:hypothetical protein
MRLETMAIGTAVILCDFRGAGQMVTSADVDELQRWSFGARTLRWPLEPQILLKHITRYDSDKLAEVSRRIRASAGLDGMRGAVDRALSRGARGGGARAQVKSEEGGQVGSGRCSCRGGSSPSSEADSANSDPVSDPRHDQASAPRPPHLAVTRPSSPRQALSLYP